MIQLGLLSDVVTRQIHQCQFPLCVTVNTGLSNMSNIHIEFSRNDQILGNNTRRCGKFVKIPGVILKIWVEDRAKLIDVNPLKCILRHLVYHHDLIVQRLKQEETTGNERPRTMSVVLSQ